MKTILLAATMLAALALPASAEWRMQTGVSKIDDSPAVFLYSPTQYNDLLFSSLRKNAELFVSCYEGQTSVGIRTGNMLEETSALIRFDKARATPMTVRRSNDFLSIYFDADPVFLAERLANVARVIARIETSRGPLDLEFATKGLAKKLSKIKEACPLEWATGPVAE